MFLPMNIVATYTKLKPSSKSFFCIKSPIQGFLEATFGFKGPVHYPTNLRLFYSLDNLNIDILQLIYLTANCLYRLWFFVPSLNLSFPRLHKYLIFNILMGLAIFYVAILM